MLGLVDQTGTAMMGIERWAINARRLTYRPMLGLVDQTGTAMMGIERWAINARHLTYRPMLGLVDQTGTAMMGIERWAINASPFSSNNFFLVSLYVTFRLPKSRK
jgi:hypothetical protein